MNRKFFIFLSFLLLTTITLSSVSAMDNNAFLDDNSNDLNQINVESDFYSSYSSYDNMDLNCSNNQNEEQISSSNVGDFNQLNEEIIQANENDTIVLDNDYELSDSSSKHILINKTITIDGNNHTIKAMDLSRVFWVKADNVIIKNLNFINCNQKGLAGGVISWWGNNGTLMNCNFINNSASSAGGAVLWKGDNCTIKNCNFSNNYVATGADVSLTDGEGYDPSQMYIQTVNAEGGAIYLMGNNVIIDYCNFINNTADNVGGAISTAQASNITISHSRFINNHAQYNGGALDLNAPDVHLSSLIFKENTPTEIYLNSENATIDNSIINNEFSIFSLYNYTINMKFGLKDFNELYDKIKNTPKGQTLVLDSDYMFIEGLNDEIIISKPIKIDGKGHILDASYFARIFNITSDNVTIKNITFINGNAFVRYGDDDNGGGAIYWQGENGLLLDSRFYNNTSRGVIDDPYENDETFEIIGEDGTIMVIHQINLRPVGARLHNGGAICWYGKYGTIKNCLFNHNQVSSYPDWGGAILWKGDFGTIINSKFINSTAYCGAAIYWSGLNGTILNSKFLYNNGIGDNGIYWTAENGTIRNCYLFSEQPYSRNPFIATPSVTFTADYNFWGDTKDNLNATPKVRFIEYAFETKVFKNLTNYLVLNNSNFDDYFNEDDVTFEGILLYNIKEKKFEDYNGTVKKSSNKTDNTAKKPKIVSKNLVKYYKSSNQFKVRIYDKNGKIAVNKVVKFIINKRTYKVKTNKKGYATLRINRKPGKYSIKTVFENVKKTNKITVKTTLITKNISKKLNKTSKFKVKVLNSKGKAYSNRVVKIKFKSKTYKLKTNKNGIATFKVPKNLKIAKYTIKTTYNGLTNSNRIVVKK